MKLPAGATMALAAALVGAAGCGGAPPPTAAMTDTKAAIRAAEEVGARQVPPASLHLKMAEDGVGAAESLVAKEAHERASLVLERAKLDAELAIMMTKTEQTKQEAEQAQERLEELKKQK